MKNKNITREVSRKWFITFNDPVFEDIDLVKILEDMLDSKILRYAIFQRHQIELEKEHIDLFILLNYSVHFKSLKEKFDAAFIKPVYLPLSECRFYVLEKEDFDYMPYEIGSFEDKNENWLESQIINIKCADWKFEFHDCLFGTLGQTRKIEKRLVVENTADINELKKTIVHELFHAYFLECGLVDYCNDEVLVNWLDQHFFEVYNQVEKILKNKGEK